RRIADRRQATTAPIAQQHTHSAKPIDGVVDHYQIGCSIAIEITCSQSDGIGTLRAGHEPPASCEFAVAFPEQDKDCPSRGAGWVATPGHHQVDAAIAIEIPPRDAVKRAVQKIINRRLELARESDRRKD